MRRAYTALVLVPTLYGCVTINVHLADLQARAGLVALTHRVEMLEARDAADDDHQGLELELELPGAHSPDFGPVWKEKRKRRASIQ